jgi:hypothetical protein
VRLNLAPIVDFVCHSTPIRATYDDTPELAAIDSRALEAIGRMGARVEVEEGLPCMRSASARSFPAPATASLSGLVLAIAMAGLGFAPPALAADAGAPGADAPPVEGSASGDPLINIATVTGEAGGAGGPGADATTEGEAGGDGGAGGRGGDATGVAEGVPAAGDEILVRAIVRGGAGGQGGAAGTGMGSGSDGIGGAGGVGGDATARATATDDAAPSGTSGARIRLQAAAYGGTGGTATGAGTRAGDGGQATATALSNTAGSDWGYSGVTIAGGAGGEGFAGADGGRGADASADDLVTAEGDAIELEQYVRGGAGGHSIDGGSAGDGGAASNRLVFTDPGFEGSVTLGAFTTGGAGGASTTFDPIFGRGADADGGDAETIVRVDVAGQADVTAGSAAGRGGGTAHVDLIAIGREGGTASSFPFFDVVGRAEAMGGDGADSPAEGIAASQGGEASGRVRVEAYGAKSAWGSLTITGGGGGTGYLGGDAGAAASVELVDAVTGYAESGRLRLTQSAEGGAGGLARQLTAPLSGDSTPGGDAGSRLTHIHPGTGGLELFSIARGGNGGTASERAGDAIAVADAHGRATVRASATATGGDGYSTDVRGGFADATARATSEGGTVWSSASAEAEPNAEARAFAAARSLTAGEIVRADSISKGLAGESGASAEGAGGIFSIMRAASSAPFSYATGDWEPSRFWQAAGATAWVNRSGSPASTGGADHYAFAWVSTASETPGEVGSGGFALSRKPLAAELIGDDDPLALTAELELAAGEATADLLFEFDTLSVTGTFGLLQVSVLGDGTTMLDRLFSDQAELEAFFDTPMVIGELMAATGLETVDLLRFEFRWLADEAGGSVGANLRMTLVPEPGTALLLMCGLTLLARRARMKH